MKLLITGATGLVGRAIVEMAHKEGVVVNYLSTKREKIVSNEIFKGYYWDPSKQELDLDCFQGVTSIINLAGAGISKKWSAEYKNEILSSRINSVKTLNRALGKIDCSSISSFVSASAIGIYPSSSSSFYDEEEPLIDDSFLGEVVNLWEKEIDTLQHFGIAIAKIRIGLVLSLDGGVLPELIKPINKYVGAALGNGQQWQSWIHINDLARMFLFVAKNQLNGIYNGVGPNPVTNRKMVKEIAEALNKPIVLPNIPRFIMKIILGEMSYLLFASQRVSSKKIAEEGFNFDFHNLQNALQFLVGPEQDENLQKDLSSEEYTS